MTTYLNYEFYFLFQLETASQQEPALLQEVNIVEPGLYTLRVDHDKRLFRWDAQLARPPLTQWHQQLQIGWQRIVAGYTRYFQPQDSRLTQAQIQEFCAQTFMGVALLIMDDTVESHAIEIATTAETLIFKPAGDKVAAERYLLITTDDSDNLGQPERMPRPAYLEEFEPNHQKTTTPWQIQVFSPESRQPPRLAPMVDDEHQANPIFAVYGLTHGKPTNDTATWPEQLQSFLCSSRSSVFARVIPRLLMQKWQFSRVQLAASTLRQRLAKDNNH